VEIETDPLPKIYPILVRDFIGWSIAVEYRDYMRRWALREKQDQFLIHKWHNIIRAD